MTIDELIQIVKSGEEMDLADMRLAFRVVFNKRPPVGWLRAELMGAIEDRLHRDHPEQFDDLNEASHKMTVSTDAEPPARRKKYPKAATGAGVWTNNQAVLNLLVDINDRWDREGFGTDDAVGEPLKKRLEEAIKQLSGEES